MKIPGNCLNQRRIRDRVQPRIRLAVIAAGKRQDRLDAAIVLIQTTHLLALQILAVSAAQRIVQRQRRAELQGTAVNPVLSGQIDTAKDPFVTLQFA